MTDEPKIPEMIESVAKAVLPFIASRNIGQAASWDDEIDRGLAVATALAAINAMEQSLRDKLSGEFSSATISFNSHAVNYCNAGHAISEYNYYNHADWADDEETQRAIADNSVWCIQWYPNTPVGFCCVAASSLAMAIAGVSDE